MVLAFGSVSLKFIQVGGISLWVSVTEVYSGRWYYLSRQYHWSITQVGVFDFRVIATEVQMIDFGLTSHIDRQYSPDQWSRADSCSINKLMCINSMFYMNLLVWIYDIDDKSSRLHALWYWARLYDTVCNMYVLCVRCYSLSLDSTSQPTFSRTSVEKLQVAGKATHR